MNMWYILPVQVHLLKFLSGIIFLHKKHRSSNQIYVHAYMTDAIGLSRMPRENLLYEVQEWFA